MSNPTRVLDLTETTSLATADQVPVYTQSSGMRRVSVSNLATKVAALAPAVGDDKLTQYAAPSATGFTVTITPLTAGQGVWLVLTPTGTLAAGTIALPASGSAVDRQEVLVNTTQTITALTVSASGLTVTGAPTTLAANGAFRMRFDAVLQTWFKVSS